MSKKKNQTAQTVSGMAPSDSTTTETTCCQQHNAGRRSLMGWLTVLLGGAAAAALGVPVVGFLVSAVWRPRADAWIDLGPADVFPIGQTRPVKFSFKDQPPWDGDSGTVAAYVPRISADEFQVFAVTCTHLGCPVSWFPQSGLFLCPCHGGVYYADGRRASGPPPRGLYQYKHELRDGRRLWILAGHLPTLENPLDGGTPA